MPKETIHSKDDGRTFTVVEGEKRSLTEPQFFPFVTVGWSREPGHVQIGILEGGDIDESTSERGGYYFTPDRDDLNRLIRTLRKARDQAYGQDA